MTKAIYWFGGFVMFAGAIFVTIYVVTSLNGRVENALPLLTSGAVVIVGGAILVALGVIADHLGAIRRK